MRPSSTATSAGRGGGAGAVDERAAADHELVHGSPWSVRVASAHLRTTEMCGTRVAIFERSGRHSGHAADVSPPTERVVATMALLAERPDAPLTLAELTRRLGVNKSTGHAILTSLAAAGWVLRDPSPQDVPARPGPGRARSQRRRLVPGPRLRPAGAGRAEPRVRRHLRRPRRRRRRGHRARPGRRSACRGARASGSARRSRCGRRSAPRWWRGPPTPCAPTGWRTCPRDTRAHYARRARASPTTAASRSRSAATPVARVRELVDLLGDDASAARRARPPRRRAGRPRGVPRRRPRPRPRVRGQRRERARVRPHRSRHAGRLSLTGFAPSAARAPRWSPPAPRLVAATDHAHRRARGSPTPA